MTPTLPFALVRRWLAFSDRQVRQAVMARDLAELDAASLALFLRHCLDYRTMEDIRVLYLDLIILILHANALAATKRNDVSLRLSADPYLPVFSFLSDQPEATPPAITRETPYDFEDVPLGVRKAKARTHDPATLRRLAEDPDPPVIAVLLENPHSTEEIALRVASLRPQTRGNFTALLLSRFSVRERVQAAMVLNPFCPIQIALALTPLLSRSHLQEATAASLLDARLRQAAQTLLAETHEAL